jgi:hypothetical protein
MSDPQIILVPLDTLGAQCREKIAIGNATLVEAARLAVEVRLRIEREREAYDGGFKAWWDTYCDSSPWTPQKLLTAGCWRETKKTGILAEPAQIEAKVAELKLADADRKRAARENNRTSDKSTRASCEPFEPDIDVWNEMTRVDRSKFVSWVETAPIEILSAVKVMILRLPMEDRPELYQWLGWEIGAKKTAKEIIPAKLAAKGAPAKPVEPPIAETTPTPAASPVHPVAEMIAVLFNPDSTPEDIKAASEAAMAGPKPATTTPTPTAPPTDYARKKGEPPACQRPSGVCGYGQCMARRTCLWKPPPTTRAAA